MNFAQLKLDVRKYLPLYLLAFIVIAASLLVLFKPGAHKRSRPPQAAISVETTTVIPKQYRVLIDSFGRIEPRTQGQVVAQVSGQIIEISPDFRDGGFFEEGDVLVKIDPRDYEIQVDIAAAELANAKVNYAEQQVLADQAVEDRKILRKKGKASDFALHIPQLAAAKSQIGAAEAKLRKAKLDVERTQVRAPYSGRILSRNVDLGDVVSANTSLAKVYATDLVEVRLPIKNSELPFITLPENANNGSKTNKELPKAKIVNSLGETPQSWQAVLVRTAGAIDEQSQQLYITAQIDAPYSKQHKERRPLKIGQYVTAEIEGNTIKDAIVIPNAAIYQGSYVYLYKDGVLEHREIEIAWQNDKDALIKKGINGGDQLVLTPLGRVSSGTPVKKLGDIKQSMLERRPRAGFDKRPEAMQRKKGAQE
jgi:RND family efflux transporter MFP subunit